MSNFTAEQYDEIRRMIAELLQLPASIGRSSVEINTTAAGKNSISVKIYGEDVVAAANKARRLTDSLALEYQGKQPPGGPKIAADESDGVPTPTPSAPSESPTAGPAAADLGSGIKGLDSDDESPW